MPNPTVVIIEDEPQIRRFVRSALEAEGWLVHEADTAKKGLIEAGTRNPTCWCWTLACLMAMGWT